MGKRKIGGVIVSDFNHTNYGSCLQAYATLQIVKGFGYDLTFIKYKKQRSIWDWLKIAPGLMLSGGFELLENKRRFKSDCRKYPDYLPNKFVGMQLILLSKKSFYLISENIKDTRPCVKVQKSLMLYL